MHLTTVQQLVPVKAGAQQPHTVSSPAFILPVTQLANEQLLQITLLCGETETDCWSLFQGGD